MPIPPLITLTTDFGLCDGYVAQMKGVILGIAPQAVIVDVTHEIPAQDIEGASAIVAEVIDAFPAGTVHLIVVDPGVGTERRPVAVELCGSGTAVGPRFVAPDNGVLTGVLSGRDVKQAVLLNQSRHWRETVSNTFHGRDLFAPVAAHWSLGIDISELGVPLQGDLIRHSATGPVREGDSLRGRIVRADSFGNLITNIPGRLLAETPRDQIIVEVGVHEIEGLSQTYADKPAGEILTLVGSSGMLEIAVCRGHAGELLAAWSGDHILVKGLQGG